MPPEQYIRLNQLRELSRGRVYFPCKFVALTKDRAFRVLVEYRVRIEEPKSRNGKRTLPLDGELVAALTALRKRSALTQKTYVHASEEDLQRGQAAIARIHKIA